MANEKVTCGGFVLDNSVFEMQKDPVSRRPMLTVTANVPTSGADFIILKSSNSADLFKITVDSSGTLKAEKYNPA